VTDAIPSSFLSLFIFLFGLVFGSFLNVVIYRIPRQLSVVAPRSACPNCGAAIRAFDNIPVLSWVLLRGRCRNCRTPISPRYAIVELLCGFLFVAAYYYAAPLTTSLSLLTAFKINTPTSTYTIGIFRIGYYGGLGARKVATITPSAKLPQSQPPCITDVATNLYDCGNWAVSASWNVPRTAVSGVYLAVLIRPDTGGASQITFVVRNDSSTSDIVFQTSEETSQA